MTAEIAKNKVELFKLEDTSVCSHDMQSLSWNDLRDIYGYENTAKGRVFEGFVISCATQQCAGAPRAVFIADGFARPEGSSYSSDKDNSDEDESKHEVGALFIECAVPCSNGKAAFIEPFTGCWVVIANPTLHIFIDGQEGLRVDDAADVLAVIPQPISAHCQLLFARLCKSRGNSFFQKAQDTATPESAPHGGEGRGKQILRQQYLKNASECYSYSINLIMGIASSKVRSDACDLHQQCLVNIATCAAAERDWTGVERAAERALQLRSSGPLAVKALYRLGQAAFEQGNHTVARARLGRALKLLDHTEPAIDELIKRLNQHDREIQTTDKALFKNISIKLTEDPDSVFGVRKGLFSLPALPTSDDGITFFDISSSLSHLLAPLLKTHLIYHCGSLRALRPSDARTILCELRVKTIIDFATPLEGIWQRRSTLTTRKGAVQLIDLFDYFNWFTRSSSDHDKDADCSGIFLKHAKRAIRSAHDFDNHVKRGTLVESLASVSVSRIWSSERALLNVRINTLELVRPAIGWCYYILAVVFSWFGFCGLFVAIIYYFWTSVDIAVQESEASMLTARLLGKKERSVSANALQSRYEFFFANLLRKERDAIAAVVHICGDRKNYPIIICSPLHVESAGLVSALILAAIGVNFSAIVSHISSAPSCLSEVRCTLDTLQPKMKKKKKWRSAEAQKLQARNASTLEAALRNTFQMLEDEYGGVISYLKKAGVSAKEISDMKSILLKRESVNYD